MTRRVLFRWALLVVLTLGGLTRPVQAAGAVDPAGVAFVDRTVTTGAGTFRYQVFVPAHLDKRKKSPVILFLHGSGERGDDNRAQTRNGIRLLIAQDVERFPCVVVCPQCRADGFWTQPDMEEMALKALYQAVQEFNGDLSRVYLTGLSMGGYGTWDLAQKFPDRWAAIAPCCGGIVRARRNGSAPDEGQPSGDPYAPVAQKAARLPAWVFHGGADPTVPVSESRQMVALLYPLKAGMKGDLKKDLKYTEYPGVGHNSWDFAYKEPGLLPWFLSHKLGR